jgi:hypothetical protein
MKVNIRFHYEHCKTEIIGRPHVSVMRRRKFKGDA